MESVSLVPGRLAGRREARAQGRYVIGIGYLLHLVFLLAEPALSESEAFPVTRRVLHVGEGVKEDLFFKSAEMFSDHMLGSRVKGKPVYLSMGMAYIELALKEKYLFKLIADIEEYDTEEMHEFLQQGDCNELLEKLPKTEKLSAEKKKEIFRMVWMFTHGVATLVTSKRVSMTTGEIEEMLKKAYEGFLSTI